MAPGTLRPSKLVIRITGRPQLRGNAARWSPRPVGSDVATLLRDRRAGSRTEPRIAFRRAVPRPRWSGSQGQVNDGHTFTRQQQASCARTCGRLVRNRPYPVRTRWKRLGILPPDRTHNAPLPGRMHLRTLRVKGNSNCPHAAPQWTVNEPNFYHEFILS